MGPVVPATFMDLTAVTCFYSACPLGFNRNHFGSVSQNLLPTPFYFDVGFSICVNCIITQVHCWRVKSKVSDVLGSNLYTGCTFRHNASRGPNRLSYYVLRFQLTFPRLYFLWISVSISNMERNYLQVIICVIKCKILSSCKV